HLTVADQRAHQLACGALLVEIDRGRGAFVTAKHHLLIERLTEMAGFGAKQQENIAVARQREPRYRSAVGNESDAADRWRGRNGDAVGLVVERDVARDDGEGERRAGPGHAFDRLGELSHDLGTLGIAEIHAVGDGERAGADGREVTKALGDRLL